MPSRMVRQDLVARLAPGVFLCAAWLASWPVAAQQPVSANKIAEVAARIAQPPEDARPLVRWWWFGPAVVKSELEREIRAMKAGGFGGVEIQPVYPMELDDPARGIKNVPYMSAAFLDAVSFANKTARANKLRVDITLGSGWPYGGPHVSVQQAASRLRMAVAELPAGSAAYAMPILMSGEKLLATFVGEGSAKTFDPTALQALDVKALAPAANGRAGVSPSATPRVVVSYIATRTGQQVKRPALGAEGFVLDHMSGDAVQHHLRTVAEPLLKAFGDQPPYAVFSDSLEVYGSDWTDDFLEQFRQRRGYDITPHLPAVYSGQGANAAAVRRDWVLTQTELTNERYLTPIDQWARAHKTLFRSQTYGEPAVSLSSNRLVALPEGEGPQHRSFSFTRLATSAGHLYGRNVISAETWTWLNSPAFAATPLDMKAEADRMLLQGVNQFVGHGWPYTPPGALEPGYSFYAAAVFNDHLPWWNVMPEVNRYLTRMSYLLRQGKPANDVAVLLPNDDVYAHAVPGKVSLSAEMHKYVTPELTTQILDAGHNLDYVDGEAILAVGIRHPLLVLPNVSRLSLAVMEKLLAYVRGGGKIIAVGSKPSTAPGYLDAQRVTAQVEAAAAQLFASANVVAVENVAALGAAIQRLLPADLQLGAQAAEVGFIRRTLADADIYFIANTSNREVNTTAAFGAQRKYAAWLEPDSGKLRSASLTPQLQLAPYESRVMVLSDKPLVQDSARQWRSAETVADLGNGWQVSFGKGGAATTNEMAQLRSWTEDAATRYFSGVAVYRKQVELDAAQLRNARLTLDFGPGTALANTPKVPAGMRAMYDSPIREAAQVIVNGKRAGALWHPPYALDITALLQAGPNTIEIEVANLALNALAGRALPDYRLLSARYGQRFIPQDTELIAPRPAGILGSVKLLGEKAQ